MKIISGKFGGRHLHTPKDKHIRPTGDKIRGAVFNMLEARGVLEGVRVLDAFCGSGALGLEALSRGAGYCCFMDKARASVALAQKNADMLDVAASCDCIVQNALTIGRRTPHENTYGLILLDPPYNKNFVTSMLEVLIQGDWIAPAGWIVCETEKSWHYTPIEGYSPDQEKTYGDTKITLLRFLEPV